MSNDLDASLIDSQVVALEERARTRLIERLGPSAKADLHRRKSAAFVALCAAHLLDIDEEEAISALVDGGGDAGIDAIYIGDVVDGEFEVVLFQGKYSQKLDGRAGYPANAIGRLVESLRSLFDPEKKLEVNDELEVFINEIHSLVVDGHVPHVRAILCNNGKKWERDGDSRIIEAALPKGRVDWVHVNHTTVVELLRRRKPIDGTLNTVGKALQEDFDHRRVFLGRVPVKELATLFEVHGDQLLDRNIRRFLGLRDNRVNSGIYKTLEDRERRGNFYFFNNGVTATCTKFTHNALQGQNYVLNFKGLQVVNGGQTSKTIQKRLADDPDGDYSTCSVLLRLYELSSDEDKLVTHITYATNSQSPVDLADLRSNDTLQDRLEHRTC